MKLRNKKTGEVREFNAIFLTEIVKETETATSEYVKRFYYKIAELNEDWEDYEPAKPLIKDEKIRKAVRAWAEAENIPNNETVYYNDCDYSFGWYNSEIAFSKGFVLENKEYSIIELCGEDDA